MSADGESWFLVNASPEIRAQIESLPRAVAARGAAFADRRHPADQRRYGPCLGLLSLRESHPLVIYATDAVRAGFTEGNVLYRTLERFPGR